MKSIPKIVHFYWGNKILPYLRYLTLYSFKKYNPDWEIKLYIPKVSQPKMTWNSSEHKFPINCKDYSNRIEKVGIDVVPFDFDTIGVSNTLSEVLKSDFLRWHLLSTQGGLWADMDILFFRPMHQIVMDEKTDTVFCFQNGIWSVGFLMASKDNSVFKHLHKVAHGYFSPQAYQSIGRMLLERDLKNIPNVLAKFPGTHVHNLSMDIVYPVDSVKINQAYSTNNMQLIKSSSVGLHWYAGKRILGHWINDIDENTYIKYSNVVCSLIRRVVT